MEVESKTSDEILEELFSALNVPLSPKAEKEPPPENQDNSPGDSEGSEDKEADSKSSDSEEEPPNGQEEEKLAKNHKHKTSKKKKEKKKKKKKHKKKDDDSRHKSKKKHKKSSVGESGEDNNSTAVKPDVEEVTGQVIVVAVEQPEKPVDIGSVRIGSDNHSVEGEKIQIVPKPKSPKSEEESDKSASSSSKRKNGTISDSGNKDEPDKKLSKKVKSPQRSHSSSKSLRSRSRSTSRPRYRHSRSRSQSRTKNSNRQSRSRQSVRSRSRSCSRTKNDSKQSKSKRSRSRSRSRTRTRQSRSRSKTRSSLEYKSKAKSPHESEKFKRKRKSSRSYSRSLSPRSSKRHRYSRSHSRSPVSRNVRKRSPRSFSRSTSPKTSRRKRHPRSRSPTPAKISSKYRSRSRSGSRKRTSQLKETSEGSVKVEPCKDQKSVIEIDLSSIPTPDVQQCPSTLPISLESIPLPVPPVSSGVQDPSSIPLPQPVTSGTNLLNGSEGVDVKSNEIDIGTIPVPGSVVETPVKEQEPVKPADTGTEKSKAKTIIIKSLKDSLIYMQAQEEAERRAKVKHDDEPEPTEIKAEESDECENDTKVEDDNDQLEEQQEEEEQIEKDDKEDDKEEETKEPEKVEETVVKKSKEGEQYEMEDGEIVSENDETPKSKSHKKKSKKDKEKNKEKKKNKKDKSKDKKKATKEKSGSKERSVKSRSKSKERSKHKKSSGSWHKEHDTEKRYRRYSRSRSRSRDRHSRFRHRRDRRYSRSRSRSRSRSHSGRRRDCVTDLRDKVTRKRLLEIARRNAVCLMQNDCLPPSVEQEQLAKIKTGGKSVEELTDFCKQLVATGNYSDAELSDRSLSSDDDNDNPDKPFSYACHPFNVRDSKPILMNIRNAPMLPTKTNAERLADHAKLREQFPVSSGSQHRNKGEVSTTEEKIRTADSGWVPVSPKEKKPKEEDSVFSKEKPPSVDISQIVSSRLSAMRKLQDNPHDIEALKTLHNVQKEMQTWALSKQEPGQFTGSTGVKILSQEELCAGQQAWVRKEQFKEAAPVRPQFGLKMLQKMGWTPGEGLGKNKEGAIEPLLLDVKMDKKGFHAQEELTPKKQPIPMAKDLSGKHPVSALVELCSKHKWPPPEFEMVFDYGPDHKKNFLMKVKVNGQEFKPAVAGLTKKLAKANAAAACLQSLGLFPKDPETPLTHHFPNADPVGVFL